MSAKRDEIVQYLNEYLQIGKFRDYGPNGMQVIAQGCDTFLTGEVGEPTQGVAQEAGVNFIAAGHYNSEKIGVQALGALLEEQFDVETFFCNVPNNV